MAPLSRMTRPHDVDGPPLAARRAAWDALWRVLLAPPSGQDRDPGTGPNRGVAAAGGGS